MPASKETIATEAWRRWPEEFGMKGAEHEYPCTARIFRCFEGTRGLVAKSFLQPHPTGGLILTIDGRELAYEIAAAHKIKLTHSAPNPAPKNGLSPYDNMTLHNILSAEAFELSRSGLVTEVSYRQAMNFWDISDNTIGNELKGEFEDFDKVLSRLEECLLAVKGHTITLDNGREISMGDLAEIRKAHVALLNRYGKSINVLINRQPTKVAR